MLFADILKAKLSQLFIKNDKRSKNAFILQFIQMAWKAFNSLFESNCILDTFWMSCIEKGSYRSQKSMSECCFRENAKASRKCYGRYSYLPSAMVKTLLTVSLLQLMPF